MLRVGGVSVGEVREAVVLYNADPPVRAPELLDHSHRDFHGVVDDIVLADRVHADFGPRAFGCFNEPYIFRWGQGRGHLFFLPVVASIVASTGSCTARVAPRFRRDPIDLFAQFFVPMALISW